MTTSSECEPLVRMTHPKGIHSAYFSPQTGSKVLTVCIDDSLRVFNTDLSSRIGDINNYLMKNLPGPPLLTQIKHNNHVGRWLTNFKATWHPHVENFFAIGSMEHPRQIQIFSTAGDLVYKFMSENLSSITSLNLFHPHLNMLAGGNSSGKAFIFS
ncbi:unnamed protein product [Gordionus sp. m RMFG-2023]